jgi:Rhomboid family
VPAAPLTSSLQDPRVLAFLLVWFGVNLLFGLGSISMAGVEQAIAWQAHIGGFLAGLLAFAAFDPIPISTGGGPNEGMDAPPPAINLDTIAGCALLAMPRRSRRRAIAESW